MEYAGANPKRQPQPLIHFEAMETNSSAHPVPDQDKTSYDYDVFISYAHDDDANPPPDIADKGWVSDFNIRLEVMLKRLLRVARIYRDKQLSGTTLIWPEINRKLAKSRMLLSVLSPNYVRSKSCLAELKYFRDQFDKEGGIQLGNTSRIIKVIKYPPDMEDPKEVQDVRGYSFFETQDDGTIFEFSSEYGKDSSIKLQRKINELAQDIVELVKLESGLTRNPPPPTPNTKQLETPDTPSNSKEVTIYLAHTGNHLRKDRDSIRDELRQRPGVTILPYNDEPCHSLEDYKKSIGDDMSHSNISIHLFGSSASSVYDEKNNCDQSIEQLQYNIACQLSDEQQTGLERMLWIPNDLDTDIITNEQQRKLIEHVLGSDIVYRTSIEEFKLDLTKKLEKKQQASRPNPQPSINEGPGSNDHIKIYLISDKKDEDVDGMEFEPIVDYLSQQGFEVNYLSYEEGVSDESLKDEHFRYMSDSDGFLVFYGKGGDWWRKAKMDDVQKQRGLRTKPIKAHGIYVAAPEDKYKRMVSYPNPIIVIKGKDPFDPKDLDAFISLLKK
jgi:hypothetical protein